jgi:hypothetical protein
MLWILLSHQIKNNVMLKTHLSPKFLALAAIIAGGMFGQQSLAQVWLPQPGLEYLTPGNTNTYRLNRTSIGEALPATGLNLGVIPQNDFKLRVSGGAIAQKQRGIYGNFTTGDQWIGLGQNPTLAGIYGMGMHRTDRYAFYNLDSITRVAPTKDLIIGLGTTSNTGYDVNQRILMKGFFGSLVNNSRVLLSADLSKGAVGINDENPLSTFFVNATGAAGSPNFSPFRSMFIINNGTPGNIPFSTFSAMGQEGNSVLNLPVHGFRTQAGNTAATAPLIAANFTVNTTNQLTTGQQEAEIQWQDLNYNPGLAIPAGFTGVSQDRLAFYFRTGLNTSNVRKRVMTMLGGGHVGINTPGIPVSFAIGNFIAGSGFNTAIRLDVRSGSVLADNYFWISDSASKADVVDITEASDLLSSLRPRQYTFLQKDAETGQVVNKIPQFGFVAQEVARGKMATISSTLEDRRMVVDYMQVVPVLVANAQKQQATIATQQATIDRLQTAMARQSATMAAYDEWAAKVSQAMGIEAPPKLVDNSAIAPSVANGQTAAEETGSNRATPGRPVANEFANTKLLQSNPNPSTGYTEIFYQFNDMGTAAITITDQQGRVRKQFGNLGRGTSKVVVNRGDLEPGTYIYSINVNGRVVASKQLVVLR